MSQLDDDEQHPAILRFGGWAFWHFFVGSACVTTIRHESVVCGPMLPLMPAILHTGKDISVVRSRLLPEPFRTALELIDSGSGARLFASPSFGFGSFGGYKRASKIVAALAEAGFDVHERRVWLAP